MDIWEGWNVEYSVFVRQTDHQGPHPYGMVTLAVVTHERESLVYYILYMYVLVPAHTAECLVRNVLHDRTTAVYIIVSADTAVVDPKNML